MALSDYTSYDQVRAALGVSSDELTDSTLALPLYAYNLVSELEEISLTLISDFAALPADVTARSAAQVRFANFVLLFSTYAAAKQLTSSLPMFSPKEQTDGKAGLVRFAQNPYKDTIKTIKEQYDLFRGKLAEAYAAINPTVSAISVSRPYFSVVSPNSDPVVG